MKARRKSLDFILNTVAAPRPRRLPRPARRDGTMSLVGAGLSHPSPLVFHLIEAP